MRSLVNGLSNAKTVLFYNIQPLIQGLNAFAETMAHFLVQVRYSVVSSAVLLVSGLFGAVF